MSHLRAGASHLKAGASQSDGYNYDKPADGYHYDKPAGGYEYPRPAIPFELPNETPAPTYLPPQTSESIKFADIRIDLSIQRFFPFSSDKNDASST